jgi:hypothetical protein
MFDRALAAFEALVAYFSMLVEPTARYDFPFVEVSKWDKFQRGVIPPLRARVALAVLVAFTIEPAFVRDTNIVNATQSRHMMSR